MPLFLFGELNVGDELVFGHVDTAVGWAKNDANKAKTGLPFATLLFNDTM